jgi:hypothetical protein
MGLRAGDILHLYVQSLRNPKHKYCVLGCIEPRPLLLLINSEVTEYKKGQPELMAGQLEIDAASHSCLQYDSWLDCTESHGYELEQLKAEYRDNPRVVVGHLSEVLQARVIEVVRRASTLSKRDIGRILTALAPPAPNGA